MKKFVVSGGAGFIGSHLVDALISSGAEVIVIDNFSTGSEENLQSSLDAASDRLFVHNLDICSEEIEKLFADFKPDAVFHLAGQMNVRNSVADPVYDADKNVVGTVNVLESARRAGCKQVVFASTGGAIYGEQSQFPADEEHQCKAESPYGISKRGAELYLEYYARYYDMRCVSLRYANVYGPRQNPKGEAGVIAIFSEKLFADEKLRVNGDGKQTRDYIYVGNVVSANLAVSQDSKSGFYIYNVGRGEEISVLDIVENLQDLWPEHKPELGQELSYEHGPTLPGEQMRSVIDSSKLSKEFSWNPDVDFKEGLAKTLLSYKS